ncbi:S8 family peptidase [Pseudarthrobacter albicanus]|uniref:S8 family peptidase n=1 Tax=Pseudarthrobacter albicanus TaxID=2823873 RepID=UPI001BA6C47C|nr:S8 family serine peptidase [Pseudarthrobacter albicanus]
MFSQFRQPSSSQPATVAAGLRSHRPTDVARPPTDRSWSRRVLAGLAAAALTIGGGIAAAAPSGAAEPKQDYIVVLKDSAVDPAATAAAHQSTYGFTTSGIYRDAVSGYAATMTAAEAQRVQADPGVDFVTMGRKFHKPRDAEPPSTQVTPLWRQRIGGAASEGGSTRAGDGGHDSADVNVAVIDSGIDATHPDLNVRGGIDCTSGSPVTVTPVDVLGHGTAVAGVIGARNNRTGVIGTAPGTPLWSVRVVDDAGLISEQSMICAIDWVTSTRRDKDRHNDIQVANISIAGPGTDTDNCGKGTDPMHYAICRSVSAGVAYTVAAGNAGMDFAGTVPATYDQVLTVTAMADFDGRPDGLAAPVCGTQAWGAAYGQKDDQPAFFSNFATQPKDKAHTVAAPGACMLSTAPLSKAPGGTAVMDGTSFASPAVAGSVALCISRGECEGSGQAVMEKFLDVTKDYNRAHRDYGFGGDPIRPIDAHYYGYLTQVANF